MVRNLVGRLFRVLHEGQRRRTPGGPGNSSLTTIGAEFRSGSDESTMIRLETPRLTLMALTMQQMRWQRDSFARLEQGLGLASSGQRLEDELRPIVSRAISHMRRRPYHARWHCQWAAVLKEERVEAVIAETANMNVASMRVLQKVGFVITSATQRYLYWKVSS